MAAAPRYSPVQGYGYVDPKTNYEFTKKGWVAPVSVQPQPQVKPVVQPNVQPQAQPQVQAQPQPQAQPGGFSDQVYQQYYPGWGRTEAEADWKATGGSKAQSSQGGDLGGIQAPQTLDLPNLYRGLYASSGIGKLEEELSAKEKAFTEARGKLNDNPYLDEASRVGREAKLIKLHNERTANLRGDIATKKADIETQLNLRMKQIDINSQAMRDGLNYTNTLLEMGALGNASGEDIANLTRASGIPSSMIYSAIEASKVKEANTQVIQSTADSGEVTVSIIDKDTGAIINQQSLGFIGNKQGGGSGDTIKELKPQFITALSNAANKYGHVSPSDWIGALNSWIARGGTSQTFISSFSNFTDPNRGDFETAYGFKKGQRGMTTMSSTDRLLTELINKQ